MKIDINKKTPVIRPLTRATAGSGKQGMSGGTVNNPSREKRPAVFLAVGIFNTLLDFGFYTLLTQTALRGPSKIALAGMISGTVALICAFLTHNFITWRERPASHITVVKFLAFTGFGMWVLRPALLSLFIRMGDVYQLAYELSRFLHLPFSYDFIAHTGSFGFMAVIVLIYNFLTYDRFVFKNAEK